MKTHVADAVALARYLTDTVPPKADKAFADAKAGEAFILVPEIAIGEFVYISLKGLLNVRDPKSEARELVREINASTYFRPGAMDLAAWERFLDSGISEVHERTIHSVARANSADAIITSDPELKESGMATIW
jgi:predicted nucleic acid-binding protein